MKQRLGVIVSLLLLAANWTPVVHGALNDSRVETPIESSGSFADRFSDWFATVGKPEPEKQSILAQRRTERAAKHAQEALERTAKNVGNTLEEAGDKAKDTLDRASADVR